MNGCAVPGIEFAQLQRLLQAVEPAVLLLRPRLVRRVIKQDRHLTGLGLQVPHRRSYVVRREDLLRIADRGELDLPPDAELAPEILLLSAPSSKTLVQTPRSLTLLKYWRTLFHLRVHVALDRHFHKLNITEGSIGDRIRRLGTVEFEEIRSVLRREEYLLPPADDRSVFVEFAALYLELRHFAGTLLPIYFPAISCLERVDALLAEDIDGAALFAATRPEGAPDPIVPEDRDDEADAVGPAEEDTIVPRAPSFGLFRALMRRAKKAGKRGNVVRAAIARAQAVSLAPPERMAEIRAEARAELDLLANRLQAALNLEVPARDRWRSALAPLLAHAARGVWPVEARLLYDLQKVCVNYERDLFALDLAGWALTLGRRPIQRPVPCQREVLCLKHLRSADRRLKAVRLGDRERRRLASLIHAALHTNERRLRDRFRPLLAGVLKEVGLEAGNLPEQTACNKLIEELLDRISTHGLLTLGDLRDGLSRNRLKLPDLIGPGEFFRGDRLLLADRSLARVLDGVHRRGEWYLRALHRVSAAAFATRAGRFLTRYALLPFGGAFVVIAGLQHLVHFLFRIVGGPKVDFKEEISVPVLGVFLIGMLYFPPFRNLIFRGMQGMSWAVRGLLIDLPAIILRLSGLDRLLHSGPVLFFRRWLLKPLIAGTLAGTAAWWSGHGAETVAAGAGLIFLTTFALFNTRLGRDLDEALTDVIVHAWQRLHFGILPELFRVVMDFFKQLVEMADRGLYRVDEWLRFRTGESRAWLVLKLALGLLWFYVAYLVRFGINLLIEPQINPIKHFPVVTVSHKLVLTFFVPPFAHVLSYTMDAKVAVPVAVTVGTMIPGVFGFLVWEFKENWRLYRANQPPLLGPVVIGQHGETMRRLLRPGFHSGTVPKLFAKLRRAARNAMRTGDWKSSRKYREALHHVADSVRNFIDREVVFLLNASRRLTPHPPHSPAARRESGGGEDSCPTLATGNIDVATNRIRAEIRVGRFSNPSYAQEPPSTALVVVFAECAGVLHGTITDDGWLSGLSPEQVQAIHTALAGLFQMAGVEAVARQQAGAAEDNGVSWPAGMLGPRPATFPSGPITWRDWVQSWQDAAMGQASEDPCPMRSQLPSRLSHLP
jgi:hypothetical protein